MKIMELTEANFERQVIQNEEPVILDFYAEWCGPCKMMAPVLEEISREHEECQIGKIDVDKCPNLAKEFRVMAVPTLMLMKDGKAEARVNGMMKKRELETWVERMSAR